MDSLRPRTLVEYLRMALRRKMLILVPAFAFALASAVAIKRLPNLYQSSTFILVEAPAAEASVSHLPIDLSRRLNTVRQQVASRTTLAGLIQKYGLYPDMVQRGLPADVIVAAMRSDIDVQVSSSRPDATDAFTISYRAKDPQTAQTVTLELADMLIAENVRAMQSEVSGEADVLDRRARELTEQLHGMELKSPWLISLKEDSPVIPQPAGHAAGPSKEAVRTQEMAVGNIRDQQYKLQQQIADLDQRISAERQLVDRQKKSSIPQDNPTLGALIAKRAELQGLRDNYINNQGLTAKHPKVVTIDEQIQAVNRAIGDLRKQGAGAVVQTPEERELATLEMDRNRLKIELDVAGRELARQSSLPPIVVGTSGDAMAAGSIPHDAASARLAQDYLGLKQTYKDVASKLQTAQLQTQTIESGKVERFRILDRANVPEVPVWPDRRLLFAAAVVMGLLVGLCFWIAVDSRRLTSLQDAKDVEYYTGLPMLGAIPRTLSGTDRKRETRKTRIRLALGAVGVAAFTAVLAKALMFSHLFELLGKK